MIYNQLLCLLYQPLVFSNLSKHWWTAVEHEEKSHSLIDFKLSPYAVAVAPDFLGLK